MKLNIGKKITGLEMALSREKIQHNSKLIELMFKGELTVYRDVLESRQLWRTFKLVNAKHKDQSPVRNDSLSVNLLVCWVEMCKQHFCLFLIQQKSLRI